MMRQRISPRIALFLAAMMAAQFVEQPFVMAEDAAVTHDSVVPAEARLGDFGIALTKARLLSYQKGREHEAIKLYEQLIKIRPDNQKLNEEIGNLYIRVGRFDRALTILEEVAAADPAKYHPRLMVAQCYLWTDRPAQASRLLEQLTVDFKDEPDSYFYLARAYSATVLHERAVATARTYAKMQPANDYKAALLLGDSYFEGGNFVEATPYYERALKVMAKDTDSNERLRVQKRLGLALSWQGRVNDALKILKLVLSSAPDDLEAGAETARIYAKEGDAPLAVELLNRLALKIKGDPKLLADYGDIFISVGHFRKARALYNRALEEAPNDTGLTMQYAGRIQSWGAFSKAAEIYQRLLQRKPDDRTIRLHLADVLVLMERVEEGIVIYRALASDSGDRPEIMLGWGKALLLQNRLDEASAIVERGLKIDNSHEQLLVLKGDIEARKGLIDEALKSYATASGEGAAKGLALQRTADLLLKSGSETRNVKGFQTGELSTAPSEEDTSEPRITIRRAGIQEATKEGFVQEILGNSSLSAPRLEDWARAYMEQGYQRIGIVLLQASMQRDSEYMPAQMALAEALAIGGRYDESLDLYEHLRNDFPESSRIAFGQARALSYAKRYDASIEFYEEIYSGMGGGYVALREAARVSYWSGNEPRSQQLYARAEAEAPNDIVKTPIHLEAEAKHLFWQRRIKASKMRYEELLKQEPANKEALFDVAQVQCTDGRITDAVDEYDKLLALEPYHKVAPAARQRLMTRELPVVNVKAGIGSENGRGELVRIRREELTTGVDVPINEDITLSVAANRWSEHLRSTGDTFNSYGPTLGIRGRISSDLNAYARFSHRFYDSDVVDDRSTGGAGLWYRLSDRQSFGLEYERADEVSNEYALDKKTQSDNITLSSRSLLSRNFELTGKARKVFFTDSNEGEIFSLSGTQAFSDEPRVFKLGVVSEFRNVDEDSVFISNSQGLQDIVHPYWTPNNYLSGGVSFDWTHDLREVIYCLQRRHYYRLRLLPFASTDGNLGLQFAGEWGIDLPHNFGVNLNGYVQHSQLYDAEQALLSVMYAF